jgi:succinoglycan biosynthesis protein ExoA
MENRIEDHPFVSILMPVRNEAKHLSGILTAVLAQDYPPELLEVIVADGVSDDGTGRILRSFAVHHPSFKVLENAEKIVPTGLNRALRASRGDVIVRVDGHTLITPDYVRQCVRALQQNDADNVGGKMNAHGKGAFGQVVALATSTAFGIGGSRFHCSDREEWVDTVYMGAWPRRVFRKIGLFDEELVRDQDDEFNYRLREHGGRILLSPKIKSTYTVRSTPWKLWRQYYQYGVWKVRVLQKHPRQMCARQFVPPAFVASLLGASGLAALAPLGKYLFAFILGAYLVANLAASLHAAAKKAWKHLLLLPLVYAILHLGYGFGFLAGLLKFANRWGDKQGKTPAWRRADA